VPTRGPVDRYTVFLGPRESMPGGSSLYILHELKPLPPRNCRAVEGSNGVVLEFPEVRSTLRDFPA